ncbi:MAG: asparagine synthase C-terminal domain-containing protein [Azoarcus sp.]|nr:asparagine synthase C-terminal domain-containing protein [Azoarcus sp.]
MIRGYIDFDTLGRTQSLNASQEHGKLVAPGFELEQTGSDNLLVTKGQQMLLVAGHPRVRDAAMAARIKEHGWEDIIAQLLASPDEVLGRLTGRFALLWADLAQGNIGFASDKFNTCGFCYAREGNRLSFGDRANAVPAMRREIDRQAVFDYLYFHAIPAPGTIFVNVQRLEPGARLLADRDQMHIAHWWQPRFEEPASGDFEPLSRSFKSLIETAVRRDLDGSPVGAFLSGGTDSSTVVGMLGRSGNPVTAYSIGFEAEGYDEMEFAKLAAKHFGVEHRPYYITPQDLVAHIPSVAASYDQPFGNSSVLPAYLCAKLARDEGMHKMFAGDGGDELFGGNTRYAKQRLFGYYDKVPGLMKRSLLEPILMQTPMGKLPLMRKAASYVEQARTPLPDRTAQYNLLYRLGIENIFQPGFLAAIDTNAPLALQRRVWADVAANALVNKQLGFDWRFTLADSDLPKVIGSTRLAGLDVKFPLLDDDLVDFSLGLPPEYKLKGLTLRWFFKEALRDFLPPEIISKKKQGFGLPFGQWALKHRPLEELARASAVPLVEQGILRQDFVDALFKTHLPAFPGYYGEMVWIMMMMGQWLEHHAKS